MKYFFITLLILGGGATYYWWTLPDKTQDEAVVTIDSTPSTPAIEKMPETELTHQTYQNKDWGITFEYPNDWEIKTPAFYSTVSKLNLSIDPKIDKKYPDTILINITPKEWIINALKKIDARGIQTTDSNVYGFKALKMEDQDMGIATISYLVLINDSYWIDISGRKEYEDVLDQVLASFIITPVNIKPENQ